MHSCNIFALCDTNQYAHFNEWYSCPSGITELAGWHHGLDGHESEWILGDGDGQGGLACCDSWGCKESDMTERLNWTGLNWTDGYSCFHMWITVNYSCCNIPCCAQISWNSFKKSNSRCWKHLIQEFTCNLTKINKLFLKMSEYEQHNACVLNRNMQELRQLWQQSCA